MDKRAQQVFDLLKKFLPEIGRPTAAALMDVRQGGEGEYHIDFSDMCIDTRYETTVPSILGNRKVAGYRVYYWKQHPDTDWEPGEAEDVTVYEGRALSEALGAIAEVYGRWIADNLMQCLGEEEEPVREQA